MSYLLAVFGNGCNVSDKLEANNATVNNLQKKCYPFFCYILFCNIFFGNIFGDCLFAWINSQLFV